MFAAGGVCNVLYIALMKYFQYIHNKLKSFFGGNKSSMKPNLDAVFGEKKVPTADPDRGTVFWTSTGNERTRQRIIYLSLIGVLVTIVFVVQLWGLQVKQGKAFSIESVRNTLSQTPLFAERGGITDRDGDNLTWNTATDTRPYFLRSYATSTGFGHLLGYVKYPARDNNGNFYRTEIQGEAGLESHYQNILAGSPGTKIVESNALGQSISESVIDVPRSGEDIQLSVDADVQAKLYSLIEETANERGFSGGAGVIMEVETGKILAATSYPEYSPAALTDGESGYVQDLITDKSDPFLNRVSAGRYTPGSVVKPFVAVAALAEGVISPSRQILSRGVLRVENPYQPGSYSIFPDWKEHGLVDMREALAVSSNEYFYQIGGGYQDQPGLGITKIAEYSRAFGLGERTGIEGISEVDGVIPTPEWKLENFNDDIWRLGDTYNTAIGQYGYQVSALQMVRGVAGLATSGQLPKPTLRLDALPQRTAVGMDIEEEDYGVVREGMRRAVTDGTAGGLNVDYVDIAAKTGTAELGGKDSGLNSWIVGFYPYNDPKYAFTVVMANGPRSNVVGGVYVMRRLLDWMNIYHSQYVTREGR